jgi:hypothetical protein
MRAARDVKVTLCVGVALLVLAGALTLTRSPPHVVRVGAGATGSGPAFAGDQEICQPNEVLPAGVSAIRLAVGAYFGSPIHVKVTSGLQVLTEGDRGPTWTGTSVTVPVTPLRYSASHVKLCIDVGPNSELIFIKGVASPVRETAVLGNGQAIGGRIGVEYLAAGQGSWWSRILTVARHMGLGRAFSGTWVALLVAALMAAVGVLAVSFTLRELP